MCLCYRFTFITFISSSSNIYKYRNNIERRYAHSLSWNSKAKKSISLSLPSRSLFSAFLQTYSCNFIMFTTKRREGSLFLLSMCTIDGFKDLYKPFLHAPSVIDETYFPLFTIFYKKTFSIYSEIQQFKCTLFRIKIIATNVSLTQNNFVLKTDLLFLFYLYIFWKVISRL